MAWLESRMCTGFIKFNLKDQNLCMFKAPLAKSQLLNTMIYLLIVIHIFAVLDTR